MGGLLSEMTVKYGVDLSNLTSGITQAKSSIASVSDATAQATAALKQMSGAADLSKTISGVDVAKANLTLLESKVTEARDKLQTLQNAADAGQSVKGLPEAEAQLTLLEAKAQSARNGLQQLEEEERQAGFGATQLAAEEEQAGNAASNLAEKSGGLLSGLKSAVGGVTDVIGKVSMLSIGYQAIKGTAQSFYDNLLKGNADMEQVKVGFETLLGAGQKTDNFLKQLQGFAASTPFEFPELAVNAQHMLAFGFTADQVLPTLTDIGDAMSAMGKKSADIDSVITVFGQMKAAGKVNAQDMMQLTSQGIPGWKFLAEAMHLTIPEVQNLSQKGLIPADAAIKALTAGMHGMFGGGMEKQATTFVGLMSTLQDNVGAAMRAFTGPLFDAAKQGLTTLGNLVSSPAFQKFATETGKQIADVFGIIGPMIGDVIKSFQSLQPVLSNVGAFFQDFFNRVINDEAIGILIGSFANMGVTIGNLIGPVLQLAGAILKVFGIDLTKPKSAVDGIITAIYTFSNIMQNVANVSGAAATQIGAFANWLNKGGIWVDTFKAGLIGIAGAFAIIKAVGMASAIVDFISMLPTMIGLIGFWAAAQWTVAAATIATALPYILIGAAIAVVIAIVVLAIMHWGEIAHWLQGVWAAFAAWFTSAMQATGAFFTAIWTSIATFFTGLWTGITSQAKASGTALSTWWTGLWNGIVAGLKAAWAFIVTVVQVGAQLLLMAIIGPILAIGQSFVWLYQHNRYVKALVDAIVDFVKAGVAWLQNAWTVAVNFISVQWQRLVGFATSIWNAVSIAISAAVSASVAWLQGIWNIVTTWLSAQWQRLAGFATSIWNAIAGAIRTAVTIAVSWLQAQWNTASAWLQAQWARLAGFAQTAWAAVSRVFSSIWGTYIAGPMQSLWNQFTGWFSNMAGQFSKSGSNFIQMLANGISSGAGTIWNAVVGIAKTIWSGLGFSSPTKDGPASKSDRWMPNLIDMMTSGLTAGIPKMQSAAIATAQPLRAFAPSGVGTAAIVAASNVGSGGSSGGYGGEQHIHLQIDGQEMAHLVMKHTDRIVKLKLGARGRTI
jgi:tape measure domain-containing protein